MTTNGEMVLVWWIKEQRTSIVKINDVNEEDRYTGCVSQVKFGKQTYPARILKISSDQEVLKIAEDQFFKEMNDKLSGNNDDRKRTIKRKKSFGSVASEHEITAATGEKYKLPPKLHEMKKNETKYARKNLKCYNQAQIELDNHLFSKSKPKALIREKNNCLKNLTSSKARQKTFISPKISQIDLMKKLNDDNDSMSESSSNVENVNPTRSEENENKSEDSNDIYYEDTHSVAEKVTDEKIKKNEVLHKRSWTNSNLGGIKFLEQYRGNSFCINMLRDLIIYLGGGNDERMINNSSDILSQSVYIDLIPIPSEHARSSLQKGSGVYISKTAESRIILEAAVASQTISDNRKTKDNALIGPKTAIRRALIEMFGRSQLSEASACGSHGKKAIRKHVLQALYHFIVRNFVNCNLSWSQFIDTINRKCEQISRQTKKHKLNSNHSKISTDQNTKMSNEKSQLPLTLLSAKQKILQDIQCNNTAMDKTPTKYNINTDSCNHNLTNENNTSHLHLAVQTSDHRTRPNLEDSQHNAPKLKNFHELPSTKHVHSNAPVYQHHNVSASQHSQPPFLPSLPFHSYNPNNNSDNNSATYNYSGTDFSSDHPIPSTSDQHHSNNNQTNNSFFSNFSSYYRNLDTNNYSNDSSSPAPSATYQFL